MEMSHESRLERQQATYHPSCYEDYKNTCSFGEATPSPSSPSNQHPLSAFKQEEETPPTSCQFALKQEEEVEEEGGGAKEIKQEVEEEVEEAGQTL